jgi:hypothetical protein
MSVSRPPRSRPRERVPPDAPLSRPVHRSTAEFAARRERARQLLARRRRRRRRILLSSAFLILLLFPAIYSYANWMLMPTSLPFGIRSTEWVRYRVPFGNWIMDNIENVYYSANAPSKGGPQLKKLPAVGQSRSAAQKDAAALPPPIKPVFRHALPGEGIWKPAVPSINGGPPVLLATYRPDLAYPQVVAYVAWFDHTRTQIGYYPGRYEPPHAAVRGPMMVPYDQRSRLLATFNGGFTYVDGLNGSADNGRTNEPLKDGNATLIGYRDGRIALVKWSGGPTVGPNVAWARQSLAPIVWNGKLVPGLNTDPNSPQWGYTLGGVTRVWRTGVGIDRHGNLIFVAADYQTVISLAQILQHVGAVRGMEFDINPEWHTLITYSHHGGLHPRMVEPQPMQSPDRYLVPDDRDFFAIYKPLPGPVTVPFK